ncbi:MAG: CBASS cGAMP-activated phospholipase [Vogesella sp.]|uniref:CBASS cGAMP-activated phospholipase n=1 Tax=Vogesella sp. TaxID=1904252 RepID=UPI00391CDF83
MSAQRSGIKILCLNGGGARGLFTINVLAEIERIIEAKTGQEQVKAGDYFDLITGTSIGGILALGLAAGKSARELEAVFRTQAPIIFPSRPSWLQKLRAAFSPRYCSQPLLDAVVSMVGKETTFNDLDRRVMIPAVNLSTGKPQFFKTPHNPQFNRDGRLKLVDAAMATSAAPTYFKPHYCADLDSYFADGGLVANNPSFIGLHEVFRDMTSDFPDATVSDVTILNIGTLGEEYTVSPSALGARFNNGYFGLWGMGERLVLTTMTANQLLHKAMLLRELRTDNAEDNYVYLDDTIPNEAASDITLDNASESSLRNLASRGKQLATDEFTKNARLQAFFERQAAPFNCQKSVQLENT